MKISYMRAARTLACCTYAYDAEMKLEFDNDKILFLHANYSDGDHFTVAEQSFFENMVGLEPEIDKVTFLEEYESLEEATDSSYNHLFRALDAFTDYYMQWRESSRDTWLLTVQDPNPNDYLES